MNCLVVELCYINNPALSCLPKFTIIPNLSPVATVFAVKQVTEQFLLPVWLRLGQELPLLQRAGTDTQLLHHGLRGAAVTQYFSQDHLEEINGQ